jgi:hypothetical protein
VIYYVQVDHLLRPARMTDANANWVWGLRRKFRVTVTAHSNDKL